MTGDTDFTMIYHLPPNIKPEEPKWHPAPSGFPSEPTAAYDDQNRVTYTWYSPTASASEYYLFGASFPRTLRPRGNHSVVKPVEPWIDERHNHVAMLWRIFRFHVWWNAYHLSHTRQETQNAIPAAQGFD